MKRIKAFLTAVILILSLTACQGTPSESADTDRVHIVAAMFAEYDFARQIAGDCADVRMLLPPGADMHSYEPTPDDIISLTSCDVFICGGGESDTWLEDILESMPDSLLTVKMMDTCELLHEDEHAEEDHGHEHEEYDEHVWTSPKNAIKIVEAITDAVCSVDSENAEVYRQNESEYVAELKKLDGDFEFVTKNAKRNEVIFADRFPLLYFAEEYGLEYLSAFPGCSHSTEASAGKVRELIDRVRSDSIPVIFKIELSNDALAHTVSEETDATVLEFHSCHSISASQLEGGETYLSLMRKNLENLRVALG